MTTSLHICIYHHLRFYIRTTALMRPRTHQYKSLRQHVKQLGRRTAVTSAQSPCRKVSELETWDVTNFREKAFNPAVPYKLPFDAKHIPSACSNWFLHDANPAFDLSQSRPKATELRNAFWSEHEDTVVPLELTLTPPGKNHSSAYATFHRSEGPLKILLAFLAEPYYASTARLGQQRSIYLAQCPLSTLPDSMQADLPTPEIVSKAGKGDIYDSSLWLGRPPTYTPLHRDPNPNFFLQLAGAKVIRLFPPQVGDAMFGAAQEILQNKDGSAAFRGEEMMRGKERELFHHLVWATDEKWKGTVEKYGQEATIGMGEALFIPKGWWHSVKSVESIRGVNCSCNFWFR